MAENPKPKDGGTQVPMYLAYKDDWNPYAPVTPGDSGVVFFGRRSSGNIRVNEPGFDWFSIPDENQGSPVFSRLGPNRWQYLGHYRGEEIESVTGEEWDVLDIAVRLSLPPSLTFLSASQ